VRGHVPGILPGAARGFLPLLIGYIEYASLWPVNAKAA
jgi:hypothetical protein